MPKVKRCNDVVGNCDFVARGESEQDILQQAGDHARTVHQVNEVTPELADKVKSALSRRRRVVDLALLCVMGKHRRFAHAVSSASR